jgi:cytochrome b6-f complex iron-sulfur subunit
MPEDHNKNPGDHDGAALDRCRFVKVGATSLGVAGLGACVFRFRYLSPNVLCEPSPSVSVGWPERYTGGSVTLDSRFGIFVVRAQEGFYALSALCTHLGCLTTWKADAGVIACPCHGSTFWRDGTTIAGPAPAPLPWLKMWLGDDGFLIVDRSTTLPALVAYLRAVADPTYPGATGK